jgi:hypothetical protein
MQTLVFFVPPCDLMWASVNPNNGAMYNLPQGTLRLCTPIFAVVLTGVVLFSGFAPSAEAATLTLSPTPIWTGNIAIGGSATVTCTLTNHGSSSLSVSKVTSTNSAYTVAGPAFPLSLSAGKSATLSIKFAPKALQRYAATITASSSAASASVALAGWGVSGAPKITASLASVNFGTIGVGATSKLSETLTNSGGSSVTIASANSNGSAFGRSGITPPVTLAPSHSITFQVYFVPKTSGAAKGSLTILSSLPAMTIPLTGTAQSGGTLSVSPTSANLGSVAVGSSKTTSATLAASGSTVVVSNATTTNSEFTVTGMSLPMTISAGKSVAVTVKFAPKASGTATGTLSFLTNASKAASPIALTGTGTGSSTHHVSLSWKSSTSVSGYDVYRGTKSGGPYTKLNSSLNSATSFMDSGVQSGSTYYYVVTSVNSKNVQSSYSSQVSAKVPTP